MRLNIFYKYTGKLRTYMANNSGAVAIGELDDYHWLDLTAGKKIGRNFNLTTGIKNLLDVQRLNNSGQSGGTHSGGNSQPVSYGRSFFLSINYSLTIKQHDEH
jgi:outer membrane receptor for ferrienterochelin and colicins